MRRTLALLAVVAGAATCAPAIAATSPTPKPQIHDGAGDWPVPSQDILDGTVTANAKTITASIHLAAAPTPGLVTNYTVTFLVGCQAYIATYRWTGVAQTESATLDEYACPSAGPVPDVQLQPTATHPATASVAGNSFRISFATLPALRPKVKVYVAAAAQTSPVTVTFDTSPENGEVGGDLAFSKLFVLGK